MVNSLLDRTVLVPGGNNGIGAAIVRVFAREGARIGLHFLETAPSLIDGVRLGATFAGRAGADAVAAEVRPLCGDEDLPALRAARSAGGTAGAVGGPVTTLVTTLLVKTLFACPGHSRDNGAGQHQDHSRNGGLSGDDPRSRAP